MPRPNLLLFMPDQLRADALGCFGNPVVQTPTIDALAARGTRFDAAYAQHPVCSPSRASIFTGWYPHTAGHRTLTNLLKPWEPNLLRLLRDAGYHVAWVGQRGDTFAPGVTEASTDFSGFLVRPQHWVSPCPYPEGHPRYDAYYTGRREADGVVLDFDEATVRTAERWLADGAPEPWVLFVALLFPHCPFEVEEPWYSMHPRDEVPEPLPPVREGKPAFHAALRATGGTDRLGPHDWAEIIATYYGMVARVDHHLGRLLEAVDRAGAADRTATLIFTDHGEYAGDFGLVEKWPSGLEECLVRNPLVVAAPGFPEGQVSHALVEMIDLLPTLLDLADARAHHLHFGRSLVPVLEHPAAPHRDAVYSEGGFLVADEPIFERPEWMYRKKGELQHARPELVGKATAVRTERWTYVHRLYEADELYDREGDPDELVNVTGRPDHADVERTLRDRMLEWLVTTSDVVPRELDSRNPEIVHGYRGPSTRGTRAVTAPRRGP